MLVGYHLHTIDESGRIIIPSKFRDWLRKGKGERTSELYSVIRDVDDVTFLQFYPEETWRKFVENLKMASMSSPEAEWYLKKIAWDADSLNVDKQGRIILPQRFIKRANLKKNIVIVGVFDYFEVWDLEIWERKNKQLEVNAPHYLRELYKEFTKKTT